MPAIREPVARGAAVLPVLLRTLAEAIRSVDRHWGVFSLRRVAPLPHQLWVCRRVRAHWPDSWLIADDTGMGKTVEAGLILGALLAEGTVRRVLLICPAQLVPQWRTRLREWFGLGFAAYAAEEDDAHFWGDHDRVVASLETLRRDEAGRHARLFAAPPWDVVVVDEAHHLHCLEEEGPTLGYRLLDELTWRNLARTRLFFTATPHRGRDWGFLALLELVRPDLFDACRPLAEQLGRLPRAVIRNAKSAAVDVQGRPLFRPVSVAVRNHGHSPAEAEFHARLTQFVEHGLAWASRRAPGQRPALRLVLTAVRKLAASSVAAIRRSLVRRRARLLEESVPGAPQDAAGPVSGSDEDLVEDGSLALADDEPQRLAELIELADAVTTETRIEAVLAEVAGPLAGRSVLFFTEYKATQALLLAALEQRFGPGVAFINGDDRLELPDGERTESRTEAVRRFATGAARFLVSTEAGGEGIDLHANCRTLIHCDLPWNPMRLHQRAGRLDRYGQTGPVEALLFRNPDTIESRIWDLLDEKLGRIVAALRDVVDGDEDLRALVLGAASPPRIESLFADAATVPPERLAEWFDAQTATFGGRDLVDTVRALAGGCARFDFGGSDRVPDLDLPDLRPFLLRMLALGRRRVRDSAAGLAFDVPAAWRHRPGMRESYDRQVFARVPAAVGEPLGIGHPVVDAALDQALTLPAADAVRAGTAAGTLVVCRVRDASAGPRQTTVVAVEFSPAPRILTDADLVLRLNGLLATVPEALPPPDVDVAERVVQARAILADADLAGAAPQVEVLTVLVGV